MNMNYLSISSALAYSTTFFVLGIITIVVWLRNRLRCGGVIFFKNLQLKRWYCPGKYMPDECLLSIVENLRRVSKQSVGSVLKYPAMQSDNINELRKALCNKVILEIFNDGKIVAFHMVI